MDLGVKLLKGKLGNTGDDDGAIAAALGGVLGSGNGKVDLGSFVEKLKGSGLANVVESWLGDGENAGISADQVRDVVGGDKIKDLAAKLGSDEGSVLDGLKDVLPQMIDKSSSGGKLLASLGGLGGLAKSFLK
ncbi:MAG: YidB family protein [Verrucomicrobia bacterium]|nr:YidB family protein [Verrucomicrobiota bacterium]MDA1086499.1 YidB family protein [Verrucomicrobiota bacterium]